ncbi:MAG: hypothetical protein M0R80_12405 [Proteobacteria bacterium]|jgi:hypothetical protein|nr:hypothetical protein [Pseudomonadota bacterium]
MIDLARARRIRHGLERLTEIVGTNSRLAARARAWLVVEEKEDAMVQDATVTIRLPQDLLDRAEKLIPRLEKQGALAATRVSKAVVIRLALLRGLDAIESELKASRKRS